VRWCRVPGCCRCCGARSSSTLAYLYANPVLNPAVLAILAFVGPGQWVTTRLVVGLVLLTVTLTPVYVLVVFPQGWFRGWLFPLHGETTMILALTVAVVLGTIIDLPTAGEVPVILALSAAGLVAVAGLLGAAMLSVLAA
jgi:uncharacterized protein